MFDIGTCRLFIVFGQFSYTLILKIHDNIVQPFVSEINASFRETIYGDGSRETASIIDQINQQDKRYRRLSIN